MDLLLNVEMYFQLLPKCLSTGCWDKEQRTGGTARRSPGGGGRQQTKAGQHEGRAEEVHGCSGRKDRRAARGPTGSVQAGHRQLRQRALSPEGQRSGTERFTTVRLQGRNYVAPTQPPTPPDPSPTRWRPLRHYQLGILINTTMWGKMLLERGGDGQTESLFIITRTKKENWWRVFRFSLSGRPQHFYNGDLSLGLKTKKGLKTNKTQRKLCSSSLQ